MAQGNVFEDELCVDTDTALRSSRMYSSLTNAYTIRWPLQEDQLSFDDYHGYSGYDDTHVSELHLAASNGLMDVVTEQVAEYNCDINTKDAEGRTPLHYAARGGKLDVVQYLIEKGGDPMAKDDLDYTPLHFACLNRYAHVVQYLLSTGRADPHAKNKLGCTPLYYAARRTQSYDLLKLFLSFSQSEKEFPVHKYTKVILTGYSRVGKTTISQLILFLATRVRFMFLAPSRVNGIQCRTAGISPRQVESKVKKVGNMVIYDFAGQKEYYSSHAAVLECVMKNSAAIFVCIVDLSQCAEEISDSMHYWMSFIENACSTSTQRSQVIVVGSHADLVLGRELKQKGSLLENIAKSRAKQLTYAGFVGMDCRLLKTKAAQDFLSLLSISQQTILSSQQCSINYYCHVLYSFLRTELRKTSCTLLELTTALDSEQGFSSKSTLLVESLISLSDKGLIVFVHNKECPQSSWVVVETESLLREVNGTLFAPESFTQYRDIASNTGIVPIATLKELFSQHNLEMLVGCLESMEFCHKVHPLVLEGTNLMSSKFLPSSTSEANYLLFPSLVKEHRPGNLFCPTFGWCLGCSDPHQFFSNRFLHVLLLRLAFTFPLASKHIPPSSLIRGLERQCKVWQNGISWKNVSGISTIVEVVDRNRWVIVLVSEKRKEATEVCSSIIRMILDLQQQLCSVVSTCECLISPSLLSRYPFDILPDTDLFEFCDAAKSLLLHHELLLDRKEGMNEYSIKIALAFEPYYLLQPSSVCQLFNQTLDSQPVPDSLFQEVSRYCQQASKPQDHRELRECVNRHSIFAGRNPLVSSH